MTFSVKNKVQKLNNLLKFTLRAKTEQLKITDSKHQLKLAKGQLKGYKQQKLNNSKQLKARCSKMQLKTANGWLNKKGSLRLTKG